MLAFTLVSWSSDRVQLDVVYKKLVIMNQKMWQWLFVFLAAYFTDLNSQYYLMIRRQLMFEIAETYNEMADLKLSRANRHGDTQSFDNHTIKKINHLCSSSAKWVLICVREEDAFLFHVLIQPRLLLSRYFQMFLDSLCSPEGKFPERLEEDVLRPALAAKFRVARLHTLMICPVPSVQLENLNKSLENYK